MTVAVIINPMSGRGGRQPDAGPRRVALARDLIARAGAHGEAILSRSAAHAIELARTFVDQRADVVVAWGGDGTVNLVAGPLIGTATALGIVPSGSGDGAAGSLNLPKAPEAALARALSGASTPIDVGFLGDRHFLNVAGVGFDAAVGQAFNQRAKRGLFGYLTTGLTMVWRYTCETYRLDIDGTTSTAPRFLITFANGREYGNGVAIAPNADPRDGILDAIVVAGGAPWQQFWRARRLKFRPLAAARGLERVRLQSATISGDRLICHVDGESFEARGSVKVRLQPRALKIAGMGV